MKLHAFCAACLAVLWIPQLFPLQSVSAEETILTPPCETTLYYSAGTAQVHLDQSLSYTTIEIYRSQQEGEFLYYQYNCGLTDAVCLAFPLIEGEYYLRLTMPEDPAGSTASLRHAFTIEDPDMDPEQLFDSTTRDFYLTCEPSAAETVITETETLVTDRVQSNEIHMALHRRAFSLSDLDGDGIANSADAAAVLVETAILGSGGTTAFSPQQLQEADLNLDGKMDSTDAAVILSYTAAYASGSFSGTVSDFVREW